MIAAQIGAGFESASAFRANFAALVGLAPGSFRKDAELMADWIETPLGAMIAIGCRHRLHLLELRTARRCPARWHGSADTAGGVGLIAPR